MNIISIWFYILYIKMTSNIETVSERPPINEELNELKNSIKSSIKNNADNSVDLKNLKKERLTKSRWVFNWPSGRETYYNLKMDWVVKYMADLGYTENKWYKYHVRSDGVKMLGDYVMVAANLKIRPKWTILETSLGKWIVCDTWTFINEYPTGLDIATNWR